MRRGLAGAWLMVGAIALYSTFQLPNVIAAETDVTLSPHLTTLDAANFLFEYRGEPINPRAVADLLPWLSDTEPGLAALDVEGSAADTNRYWAEISVVDEGPAAGIVRATWNPRVDQPITYSSSYRWLGRLDNGLHILRVTRNMGGSGVFASLLFVRFEADTEYYYVNGPGPRERLVMKRMGSQSIGYRDGREIRLKGNSVVIGADEQNKEVRIDLSDF